VPAAPLSICSTGQYVAQVAGDCSAATVTWDFQDGTSATGTSVQHRYLVPGVHQLRATASAPGCAPVQKTATVQSTAVDRSVHLRFQVKVALTDRLDYVRDVTLDARALGVPVPVRMSDDGVTGGDAVAGDGQYTADVYVAGCEDLQQLATATVQGAAGRTRSVALRGADYVAP
jgi:PKD repeat protein